MQFEFMFDLFMLFSPLFEFTTLDERERTAFRIYVNIT